MNPWFKKVYVEITSGCNLRCSFCPPTRRPAAFLTPDQFQHIVGEIAGFTQHVYFHVKGEPLLHPRLAALLDLAAEASLKAHLVTNGTLLAGKAALLLAHPAVHKVDVSLHSFEGAGRPQAYLEPILEFAERAEAEGRLITVLRLWRQPNTEILGAIDKRFSRDGHRLGRKTFLDFEQEFAWPTLSDPHDDTDGFCLGLRDQAAILVDGTVVPCCLDGEGVVALGNVFEQPFGDIIDGPRARAVYQGFTERRCVEELCRKCRFKDRFGAARPASVLPAAAPNP